MTFAATDEDAGAVWTEVKPDISGAGHTFWVPMDENYPYILVNPEPGDYFMPNRECHAFPCGELTGFRAVDRWLSEHRALLDKLRLGETDQYLFYQTFEWTQDCREKEIPSAGETSTS